MSQSSVPTVISLGGSVLVPDKVDTGFARRFREILTGRIGQGDRFILVVGGGRTARDYIAAADAAGDIDDEDGDWIGIHATRLNAHFLRTLLKDHAFPRVCTNPHDLDDFRVCADPVLVAAGWRPGFSTDYVAVLLAREFGAGTVLNLSNIDYVYDKDPKEFHDARKEERMTWAAFRRLVGDEWSPGLNAPFDPVAARLAAERELRVVIMNGKNYGNLERFFGGEPFEGTVIG